MQRWIPGRFVNALVACCLFMGLVAWPIAAAERWWNHYDRAKGYAERGLWVQAVEEYKKALSQDSTDRRRARTYGVHFIEYFPHRNLGIAYYHLKQWDKAVEELTISLSQEETPEAREFLEKANREFQTLLAALAKGPIVVVKSLEAEPYELAFQGFKEGFEKKYGAGFKEYTLKESDPEKGKVLSELKALRPPLILTLGSSATTVIHEQVKDMPVVFCMVLNPVASGFVQSMESSGNNLTGASLDIPVRAQFETLKAVVPSVKRVGVLYNPGETREVVGPAAEVAREVGLELIAIPVSSVEKLQETLDTLERKKIDALWSVADSTVFSSDRSIEFLLRQTLKSRIPFMGLSPAFVKAGALLALSVDYTDVGVQCGELAVQVLAGQRPSMLPITVPRRVTLYLNMNVAKAIGVKIPARTMEGAVVLR
ncbi:MAG: ABC transporter substrate-binding protein [candidate division NC10 bacterium]|nr:ABC transporter substrate-binding protein [candidate division NC10 bacterium]